MNKINNITATELYKLLNDKEKIILLDVREEEEVKGGIIPSAIVVPKSKVVEKIVQIIDSKDKKIVVYCATGGRSLAVSKILLSMGYKNVFNLLEGFKGWQKEGFPVSMQEQSVAEAEYLPSYFFRRYLHHFKIPQIGKEGQIKLMKSKVLVIGAGGLGSPALLYLSACGVGNIGIIDNDIVEESNLQRQVLHFSNFIGKPKTESAYNTLKNLNPYVNIKTYNERLTKHNIMSIFREYDLIIDGSDNFPTRYLTNDACFFLSKPFIYASVYRFEGQLSCFFPRHTPCFRCLYPQPPSQPVALDCQQVGVLGILPGIMGILQALEAVKIILNIGKPLFGKLLYFDALEFSFSIFNISRKKECILCGEMPKLKELVEYEQFCNG
jgi:sulfur-carrier protein adenylyltransferase/sulfurtransferase